LTAGLCSALGLLLLSAPGWPAPAGDDVFQPHAQLLHPESKSLHRDRIDVPGEHDWYAISGLRTDYIEIVLSEYPTPTCTAPTPLLVSLYTPEGLRMRTVRVSSEDALEDAFSFDGPGVPGRYVLDVRAPDPRCAGLEYFIGVIPAGPDISGARAGLAPSRADVCRFDRAVRIREARRVSRQKRRVRSAHGKKRERYLRILRRYERGLREARALERRSCAQST